MKGRQLGANIMLLAAAAIWGSSFSIIKIGFQYMTPFLLNGFRFMTATIFVGLIYLFTRKWAEKDEKAVIPIQKQIVGGLLAGTALATGAALQQWGLLTVTASNTGFITSVYTILVPFFCFLIFHTKIKKQVWFGAGLAILGMILISAAEQFQLKPGDIAILAGAVAFAIQIIVIGRYIDVSSPFLLAVAEMFAGGIWSFLFSLLFEEGNTMQGVKDGLWVILLTGILSLGVAHTLQIIAQKQANPSVTAIILSLEAVFAAIFGAMLLGETMNLLQVGGCTCVFISIIIAQIDFKILRKDGGTL